MLIKAVAFDIDGTLYPNFEMYLLSIPSFLGHPRLAWHFSRNRREIRKIETIENFRQTQAEMIARRMGADVDKVHSLVEERLYKNWERSFRFLVPYPYVKTFIMGLKDRGLKLGVLSDFPPQNKLKYMGLDGDHWDACFSSEESRYLKPRKEAFLEMIRRLETPAENILYIGNSYRYDVLGASGAGMRTAYLSRKKTAPPADFTFTSYRRLEGAIRPFLAGPAG